MTSKRMTMADRIKSHREPLPEPSAPQPPKADKDGRLILSIWVDPALRQHLKAVAVKQNTTLNALLQRYIHAGLQNDGETPR